MYENDYAFHTPSGSAPQTTDAQNTAPVQPASPYQAAPQARSVYSYSQPRSYPAYAQTRTAPQAKPKKKRMTTRVAVVALCCAILGSVLGGGAVGLVMHRMYQKDTAAVSDVANVVSDVTEPQKPTEATPARTVSNTDLKTPAQIYEQNVGAVVGIANEGTTTNVFGQVSETASSGSGFVISSDGEILTNYHVVGGAKKLTVTLYDGRVFPATVLGYEAESDVALLKIDATGLQTVTLGDSDALQIGDQVSAIGNPLGELTYSITVGFLSAKDRAVNTDGTPINMMQIDAAINPGNSGGPLFDQYGSVIGITTAKYSGTTGSGASIEGIGFAIPINDVLAIVDELRETGTVSNRAYIGIYVSDVTADQKEDGLPGGVYVSSVVEGSSGEKAGLKEGDVITAVGGAEIKDTNGLSRALKTYRGGDSAVLTVWRGGRSVELPIVFDSKSSQTNEHAEQPEPTEPTQEPETETEPFDPWEYFPWDLLP